MLNTFAKFTQYFSNIFQNILNFSLSFALKFNLLKISLSNTIM